MTGSRPIHKSLKLVTPPAAELFDVSEAKLACRIDGTVEDAEIARMIAGCRGQLEAATARAFITQTWRQRMDRFPRGPIDLRVCPVQPEGVEITYVDTAGDSQTVDPETYVVDADSEPARINLLPGYSWPCTQARLGAVTVTFQAGYGDLGTDVPEEITRAVKLLVGDRFRYRDVSGTKKGTDELFQKLVVSLGWGAWP